MEQQGGCRFLSTCRHAVDTHVVGVHVRILGGSGLDPLNVVGQSGVLQVLIADLLKLLATVACAHTVDLNHDEAQLGQSRGIPEERGERLGNVSVARSCIDILDDGISLRRVEVGGTVDESPHVGLSIATLRLEYLRSHPAIGLQLRDVGRLKRLQQLAVDGASQLSYRRHIGLAVNIYQVFVVG